MNQMCLVKIAFKSPIEYMVNTLISVYTLERIWFSFSTRLLALQLNPKWSVKEKLPSLQAPPNVDQKYMGCMWEEPVLNMVKPFFLTGIYTTVGITGNLEMA